MKKILMMAFVSAAMLAMVSCSKDKEEEAVSLVGTHWVGTETFNNIPMIGMPYQCDDQRNKSPGQGHQAGHFDMFHNSAPLHITTPSSNHRQSVSPLTRL